MVVYKITNLINKKIYIGQTRAKLRDRWNSHCRNKNNSLITAAINKYGRENFTIEVIDNALTTEELNKKEAYWIQYYDSSNKQIGYNIMPGGDSHTTHSPETKEKLRDISKNMSQETRKKIGDAQRGRKHSQEFIEKRIAPRRGYKWSEESKQKSRDKQKGRRFTEEHKLKIKEARKRQPVSERAIEAMRCANIGKKASPELREKHRLNALKREQKKLEERLKKDPSYKTTKQLKEEKQNGK